MKKFRTLTALLVIALMTTVLAACGGSSPGIKRGEDFTVGEYTMKYESTEISGSEATVTLLMKGMTGIPVTFINGQVSFTLNAKLGEGDNAIKASKLSADSLADEVTEDEYGARVSYTFENISDADYQTATIYLLADESQFAVLDFRSGLGEAGSPGDATSTGIIIAVVLVALAVAGGIFAAKKGFFKKDPGPGAAGAVPGPAPAAPTAEAPAVPGAAPAAPVIPAAEPAPAPEVVFETAPEPVIKTVPEVTFAETVMGDDGVSTYEVYKGPDKASAIEFLKTKTVDQENYFVVVDTPEGNFGRDNQGLYQE